MGRGRAWERLSDERLLDLRLCDLGLSLSGTWVEEQTEALCDELARRELRVRPHFWLSDDWFSPDGVPGIAIPFFLVHPRLRRLERKQMLEVEGGTRASCLRLLRHEAGHAVHHAFILHRRRRWQRVFGRSTIPYPTQYRPNPASRRYVIHLDYWYAQSHPHEDFAETFAVWLAPRSSWRKRYQGWPALAKLEYVDELMAELASRRPPVRRRAVADPVSELTTTLREYYQSKRARYEVLTTNIYDDDLLRHFTGASSRAGEAAASFLTANRATIRRMVAKGTGKHPLALDMVLKEMIARCRELGLRATGPRRQLLVDLAILLAARSVEYVYRGGRDWRAL